MKKLKNKTSKIENTVRPTKSINGRFSSEDNSFITLLSHELDTQSLNFTINDDGSVSVSSNRGINPKSTIKFNVRFSDINQGAHYDEFVSGNVWNNFKRYSISNEHSDKAIDTDKSIYMDLVLNRGLQSFMANTSDKKSGAMALIYSLHMLIIGATTSALGVAKPNSMGALNLTDTTSIFNTYGFIQFSTTREGRGGYFKNLMNYKDSMHKEVLKMYENLYTKYQNEFDNFIKEINRVHEDTFVIDEDKNTKEDNKQPSKYFVQETNKKYTLRSQDWITSHEKKYNKVTKFKVSDVIGRMELNTVLTLSKELNPPKAKKVKLNIDTKQQKAIETITKATKKQTMDNGQHILKPTTTKTKK